MPQFELEDIASRRGIERVRAISAEAAVRQWLSLPDDSDVELGKAPTSMDELEGWFTIRVGGVVRGRVRPHQRMRFRRD